MNKNYVKANVCPNFFSDRNTQKLQHWPSLKIGNQKTQGCRLTTNVFINQGFLTILLLIWKLLIRNMSALVKKRRRNWAKWVKTRIVEQQTQVALNFSFSMFSRGLCCCHWPGFTSKSKTRLKSFIFCQVNKPVIRVNSSPSNNYWILRL